MTRVIDIVLEEKYGEITVSPTTVYVEPNEDIRWEAFGAEALVVVFPDRAVTALDAGPEITSQPGKLEPKNGRVVHDLLYDGPGTPQKDHPIAIGRATGPKGAHPYHFAIREQAGGGRLHMDAGCPEVIIR